MKFKLYLVLEKRLFCQVNDKTYEYVNGEWIDGDWREVKDRLMGYDPSDNEIGDSDILSSIKEISKEEVIGKFGQEVIDRLNDI